MMHRYSSVNDTLVPSEQHALGLPRSLKKQLKVVMTCTKRPEVRARIYSVIYNYARAPRSSIPTYNPATGPVVHSYNRTIGPVVYSYNRTIGPVVYSYNRTIGPVVYSYNRARGPVYCPSVLLKPALGILYMTLSVCRSVH